VVTENVFSNRFRYVDELSRMGAQISVDGRTAIIRGASELTGARVSAPDLRAGAALVVAGLAARGETIVDGVEHITRGYDRLPERLASCGAQISHTVDAPEAASFDS
jgi:UDP-N-acetylglucosamine 1-carboxyvinyltransferase